MIITERDDPQIFTWYVMWHSMFAGVEILKAGGNAADASVTTALCEGLFNPMASGIGGGAFITVLMPNGSAEVVDAREFAPTGATEKMFKGARLLKASCHQTHMFLRSGR